MLASITPLGERARRARWGTTATLYVLSASAGGALIGTLAGAAGSVTIAAVDLRARLALVACALALGFGWEAVHVPVPGPRRQVNEQWLGRYRSWVYGVGFGAQLGAGVTTVVMTTAVYVVAIAAFASATPGAGALIGAAAGGLRGATVLAAGTITTPRRLVSFHDRMGALERPVRSITLAAQLALAAIAIGIAAVGSS